MRPTGIGICAVLAGDSDGRTIGNCSHEIGCICYSFDSQPNNIDILLGIFSSLELLSSIKEIEQFTTVNFIERKMNF